MKVALICALLCVPAAAQTAAPPSPAGHWEGTIELPHLQLQVMVDLTQAASGWQGTIDIPMQGAKALPLEKIDIGGVGGTDSARVRFTIAGIPGSPTFDGRLEDGALRGTFTQGAGAFPFKLGREAVKPLSRPQEPKPPFPYTAEEVTYESGAVKLAGTLTLPPGPGPFPAVVLITGSGPQNRDEALLGHKPFLVLADHLTRAGIAVLRADDRGVGGSTGNVDAATTSDFADDALAAVRLLKAHPRIAHDRIGLLGHSEGGIVAPLTASRSPAEVAFVVLLAGTGVPGLDLIPAQVEAIDLAEGMTPEKSRAAAELTRASLELTMSEKDPAALRAKLRQLFTTRADAIEDQALTAAGGLDAFIDEQVQMMTTPWFRYLLAYDPRPALARVRVPVLAVNGALDRQVPAELNLPAIEKALRDAGNKDVTARSLPGLNHLFQTAKTGGPSEYASIEETMSPLLLDTVTAWIVERFGKPATAAPAPR